jgi:hypothetical protein
MTKPFPVCVLALLFLLPAAIAEIDTTSYTELVSQIDAKQIELEAARASGDWDGVMILNQELKPLETRLVGSEMRFLGKYIRLKLFLDESNYLAEQINVDLVGDSTSQTLTKISSISQTFDQMDAVYNSQNYEGALSLVSDIETELINLPTNLVSSSVSQASTLKTELESTSPGSQLSMIDDSRRKLTSAGTIYNEAVKLYPSGDLDKISDFISEAHGVSSDAYTLISRSKIQDTSFLESIKWFLILGPLVLIVALFAYFRTQFKKTAIRNSISTKSAPGGKESIVERYISLTNMEEVSIRTTLSDTPPKALQIEDFNTAPTRLSGNKLEWDFELSPSARKTISYKLKVPSLDSGWQLKIPGAKLIYEIEGKQKEVSGKNAEIKIA